MDWHALLLSIESTAGNAGGRLCPLHQPLPRLRATDTDGPPIALLLHPGNHGRIQRSVTLPPGFLCSSLHFIHIQNILSYPRLTSAPWVHVYLVMSVYDVWYELSPCFVWFRDVQGQKWAAEDPHLHGPLPRAGGDVCEAVCWYLRTHLYQSHFWAFLM